MNIKKILNNLQFIIGLAIFILIIIQLNSSYLQPYLQDPQFSWSLYVIFTLLIIDALLNIFQKRFGIWLNLSLAAITLAKNINYSTMTDQPSQTLIVLTYTGLIILIINIIAAAIHLHESLPRKTIFAESLEKFKIGRIYVKLTKILGLFLFTFTIALLSLEVETTRQLDPTQNENQLLLFWANITIFIWLLLCTSYINSKIKKIKQMTAARIATIAILLILTPSLIAATDLSNQTTLFSALLYACITLAWVIWLLQALEYIFFQTIIRDFREKIFAPNDKKIAWSAYKNFFYSALQISLLALAFLEWKIVISPPGPTLFTQFQNLSIISITTITN